MQCCSVQGSEDCLHLNVFTPQLEQEQEDKQEDQDHGYAVLVWLHGGSFSRGSASPQSYGPDRFLDRDLVVVTLNYRLGALGFLTTEDAAAPPNLGLRDQQLALTWVRENIRAFGGNPQRVTLCGEAAGGSSVMAHVASPRASGLFQQAVAMSGVWGFHPFLDSAGKSPRRYALLLAAELGCGEVTDSEAIVRCLRHRDAASIVVAAAKFQRYGDLPMVFKPMRDSFLPDSVLPDDPWSDEEVGRRKQNVPLLIGANRDEGIVSLLPFLQNKTLFEQLTSGDFATAGPVLLFGAETSQVK
jgi:carboxylesterase type B